jgi:hypothetical protein
MKFVVATLCDGCRSMLADARVADSPVQLRHVVCQAKLTQSLRIVATHFDFALQVRGVMDEKDVDDGRPLELTPWAKAREETWAKAVRG